jgi:RNA polymerase sigma factor (sigma-70 family)
MRLDLVAGSSGSDGGPTSTIPSTMTTPVESWFQAAMRRWPKVKWSLERFGVHVGSELPNHPEDLYLGGAASERLTEAWSVINEECRPEVLRRVGRLAGRSGAADDLWGEAVVRMMSEDPDGPVLPNGQRVAKIRRYRGAVPLPSFIAVVAKRIGVDLMRKDAVSDRLGTAKVADAQRRQTDTSALVMEEELAARFAVEFQRGFSSLSPSQQALLSLVYGQGLPKGEAGRLLGMRDYKVSRELAETMEVLRERLTLTQPGSWTPQAVQLWTEAWTAPSSRGGGGSSDEA